MAKIDTNYVSKNFTLNMYNSFYLGLPEIKKSEHKIHFRISFDSQTINFSSNDSISFQGTLTNEITEYKSIMTEWGESNEPFHIVYQTIQLDSTLSTNLADQILKSGQNNVPTDSLIKTWNSPYLHCGSIIFQFKINNFYNEQSFHCPWSQPDSVEYKNTIVSNYHLLNESLDLKKKYKEFTNLLPKGKTYSRDGYRMMYVFTDKQSEAWKKDKPRRDYLKSIKDTIDSFINIELSKQEIELDNINCFVSYNLIFGTNGKLEKIKIPDSDKPKISDGFNFYFEDKREIRKCRKIIKRIFKKLDLSSFNLKHKIYRSLNFRTEGKIQLSDNTFY